MDAIEELLNKPPEWRMVKPGTWMLGMRYAAIYSVIHETWHAFVVGTPSGPGAKLGVFSQREDAQAACDRHAASQP